MMTNRSDPPSWTDGDTAFAQFLHRRRNAQTMLRISREARFGRAAGERVANAARDYDAETQRLIGMIRAFQIAAAYTACQTRPLRAA